MTSFNVKTVELSGSNLIEASAGTGKTWSVSILVLRMILEKEVPIEKILMVTFTKAAVAELEARIRDFVRQAYKHVRHEKISNTAIVEVVGSPNTHKLSLLKKAVQSLDRLSVMTIHSFCQEMIRNNPFESGQSFESEMMTDSGSLVEYFVNEAWRKEINTLEDKNVFKHIHNSLSREDLMAVVTKVLGDRVYVYPAVDKEKTENELKAHIDRYEQAWESYVRHIQDNWDEIASRAFKSYALRFINDNNAPQLFIQAFFDKCYSPPGYFSDYFQTELTLAQNVIQLREQIDELTHQFKCDFYGRVIQHIKNQVERNKERKNIITFDDLISSLHKAVMNRTINHVALNTFDAVFIDEFQDTDKKQYEIFHTLFAGKAGKILFYIGDPKQSIYGWRKADIVTYKKAKNEVDAIHTMNDNFRSTARLIDALNTFIGIEDPFYDEEIQYQKVGKGKINLGEFTESGEPVLPLAINSFEKNDYVVDFVKTEILRLLTTPEVHINGKPIKPSDIAVLVRGHYQAESIKEALSAADIPSVTVDDASVFLSDEALWMKNLMETVMQPRRGSLNKLLLNPRFGFDRCKVENLNNDEHLEIFRRFKTEWKGNGIYNMIFSFFGTYNVIEHCMKMGLNGQRSLSNFLQLAELLHHREQKTKFSPEELISWINRQKDEHSEEHEQRIESEDDAVRISTIHKSKGLTYKVVFAPFLDLKVKEDVSLFDFRDEEGYKFTHRLSPEQETLWRDQQEQENRRLLYVALTRAQYKTYICENHYKKETSLKPFLKSESPLFEVDVVREAPKLQYKTEKGSDVFAPGTLTITFEDIRPTFGIHSFSGLNSRQHSTLFQAEQLENAYDHFIFQQFPRGATAGNALHSIFERLHFDQPETWEQTLLDAVAYYPTILNKDGLHHFQNLVQHTMEAEISLNGESFRLGQIPEKQKLPELQFNFSIKDNVSKEAINQILGEEAELAGDATLQGLMTGFVDLLFLHNNKYYILDWKSNYLGNTPEDYSPQALDIAMKASNYTLQYLIYTVAVKRWLESRLQGFDYERDFGGVIYLYLRGIRQGKDTGIFIDKPAKALMDQLEDLLV
ncbi:MAG: hypothetical protein EA361_19075 [Bacteroidetes bacterium]|nr:MAG: hypothetical protein EA361_19075 [Bacteroidota bacterium]